MAATARIFGEQDVTCAEREAFPNARFKLECSGERYDVLPFRRVFVVASR